MSVVISDTDTKEELPIHVIFGTMNTSVSETYCNVVKQLLEDGIV